MKHLAWSVVFGLLAVGCSDADVSVPIGASANAAACAPLIAGCLENQKSCAVGPDGPACVLCPENEFAAPTGVCEAIPGAMVSHDFQEFTTESGGEVIGLCQSWTMDNPTELWVQSVELLQDEGSHHSNWTYVPDTLFEGPDGVWDCDERGYTQVEAALSGGVLYAQSTQASKEVQKFPNGAAIRIPPHARIIGDVHLLNTTQQAITGHAKLNVYSISKEEVTVKLAPFHLTFETLAIPPHAKSRFVAECDLGKGFESAADIPFGLELYYALPHTHAMGKRFFFEVYGGPEDGKELIDVEDFNSEARGRAYDPPMPVEGAKGLRFGCEYDNNRDEEVVWGFGDQEMCEMLGFADSKVVFESAIHELQDAGKDGDVNQFTGPCKTLAVPWSNDD